MLMNMRNMIHIDYCIAQFNIVLNILDNISAKNKFILSEHKFSKAEMLQSK